MVLKARWAVPSSLAPHLKAWRPSCPHPTVLHPTLPTNLETHTRLASMCCGRTVVLGAQGRIRHTQAEAQRLTPCASHPGNSPATGQALPTCWSPEEVCREGGAESAHTPPLHLSTRPACPSGSAHLLPALSLHLSHQGLCPVSSLPPLPSLAPQCCISSFLSSPFLFSFIQQHSQCAPC